MSLFVPISNWDCTRQAYTRSQTCFQIDTAPAGWPKNISLCSHNSQSHPVARFLHNPFLVSIHLQSSSFSGSLLLSVSMRTRLKETHPTCCPLKNVTNHLF